mmetsp:Transcript_7699/g.22990  ORF Transcript_7699/g.22990 Transcript_7699/m.22990 type:complete len:104 (-) Transcript_7699:254-565(-)
MYAVAASSAKVVAQTTRTNSAHTKRASAKPAKALKNPTVEKTVIATTALVAASIVSPEASHAAQNVVAQVAEGEPLLVDVAWGAILSSFSFSLALVVWGRSGL